MCIKWWICVANCVWCMMWRHAPDPYPSILQWEPSISQFDSAGGAVCAAMRKSQTPWTQSRYICTSTHASTHHVYCPNGARDGRGGCKCRPWMARWSETESAHIFETYKRRPAKIGQFEFGPVKFAHVKYCADVLWKTLRTCAESNKTYNTEPSILKYEVISGWKKFCAKKTP